MNDTKTNSSNTLRFDLVTELLQGLEGEKSIAEALTSAEKLFVKDVFDKAIVQAKQQIATLKQRYSQGDMKDDEAKAEVSNILFMLT